MKERLPLNKNNCSEITNKTNNENEILERINIGIDYVFNNNPELYNIGTKKQYFEYLKTIFPSSLVKKIVYHGTDIFEKSNQKISDFDNLDEGTFFTDNINYAKSYAKYRGGNIIIPAILNIQNPANEKDLDSAFGFLNEDPNMYEGYYKLKKEGFDGYISEPNFDTPFSEIYTNDPEFIADQNRIAELMKTAKHIDLDNLSKDFVVDGNYAIHGPYYYTVIRFLDANNIQYNLYSIDTIKGIAYVNNETPSRKSYQSVTYLVFNDKQIHILGTKNDMEKFKEYLKTIQQKKLINIISKQNYGI